MKESEQVEYPERDESFIFPFGKYKGLSIKEVLQKNPYYVIWLGSTINFKVTKGVRQAARHNLDALDHAAMSYIPRGNSGSLYYSDMDGGGLEDF